MTLAILTSRANVGIYAPKVSVEVHITHGKPIFSIVGLPETAVKESRDRVRSALINSGFDFPMQRITVNLAPADLPKEGGRFDLAIALGILAACGLIPQHNLQYYEFSGELALSGELKAFNGALLFSMATAQTGRALIVPIDNAVEAAVVENSQVYGATHLLEVYQHLLEPCLKKTDRPSLIEATQPKQDLADVYGQPQAKRALIIAAAGGHHLLFIGPPGTGKTLLANRLLGLLPPLTDSEALENAAIRSLAGLPFQNHIWQQRPFRSPHHTASSVALVGGGSPPKPGEISLAHHGVLFLDELPEFNRSVLEALREPLEAGIITIARAAQRAEFPAQVQLIAAMNPCPCGYHDTFGKTCRCSLEQIKRYQQRLSGPFLDRIDLHVSLKPVSHQLLLQAHQNRFSSEQSSRLLKTQVINAQNRQLKRQQKLNNRLSPAELKCHCHLDSTSQALLEQALSTWQLSARAVHRLLRVARTIADLMDAPQIDSQHVSEALSYRCITV